LTEHFEPPIRVLANREVPDRQYRDGGSVGAKYPTIGSNYRRGMFQPESLSGSRQA
jgi:hypothetical protein